MASIRAKKKLQTEKLILQHAEMLFSRQGYQTTTMEDIAEAALVGVGTIYNYFGGKGELLIAIMAARTETILADAESASQQTPRSAVDAVSDLLARYAVGLLSVDIALLRETISQAIAKPKLVGQPMLELDQKLITHLAQSLARWQTEHLLASDISPEQAAFILYAQLVTFLMLWILTEAPSEAEVRAQIQATVALMLRDWQTPGGAPMDSAVLPPQLPPLGDETHGEPTADSG